MVPIHVLMITHFALSADLNLINTWLDIPDHHSIRMRIGIDAKARNAGGINIFGRCFRNFDQDIVMRMALRR